MITYIFATSSKAKTRKRVLEHKHTRDMYINENTQVWVYAELASQRHIISLIDYIYNNADFNQLLEFQLNVH